MSLIPRSITVRIIIILLAGLLFAQLASLAIHWRDRGELMWQVTATHFLQRMASITRALDRAPTEKRVELAKELSSQNLRIQLLNGLSEDADNNSPMTRMMTRRLKRMLGGQHKVRFTSAVASGPPPPMLRPPHNRMPGMHRPPMALSEMQAEVELSDGSAVSYRYKALPTLADNGRKLLLSLAILLGVIILLSVLVVRLATRPLRTLSEGADALAENLNRPPLPEKGPQEVVAAARALNRLQDRLQTELREKSEMLAAVSHDLRTPLTRLRLRSEMLKDRVAGEQINGDLDDMELMIHQTLEFMRGMEKREPDSLVDLEKLLGDIVQDLNPAGEKIQINGASGIKCIAQALALKRCLTNLMENALKYGATAEVHVAKVNDSLCISIRDHGPGLPESSLEQVFQPFHRLDSSRSRETGGVGMGLAIARNIARLHDGDISLRNRPEGGLEAELKIPCHPST